MLQDIGESAGQLWHYLKENPQSTMEDAAKSLKLKENMLAMAVGWLAREDKVDISQEKKSFKVVLR